MEKYSKKQRREIYLGALGLLLTSSKDTVLCHVLGIATNEKTSGFVCVHMINIEFAENHLPEFAMFKPENIDPCNRWFDESCCPTQGYYARINCLLLCAEMCK